MLAWLLWLDPNDHREELDEKMGIPGAEADEDGLPEPEVPEPEVVDDVIIPESEDEVSEVLDEVEAAGALVKFGSPFEFGGILSFFHNYAERQISL